MSVASASRQIYKSNFSSGSTAAQSSGRAAGSVAPGGRSFKFNAHTHTHTHIYIYLNDVFIWGGLVRPPAVITLKPLFTCQKDDCRIR